MSEVHLPASVSEIASRARTFVNTLAGNFPSRNGLYSGNLAQAAAFIEEWFSSVDLKVKFQDYWAYSTKARNLIVEQKGKNEGKPCIVIGAHYDTVLNTPGADDNASGVAGLVELARLFRDYENERTIHFVAFTLEEPPYFFTSKMGSRVYAKQLRAEGIGIQLMMSLEMIGFAGGGLKQAYPFPLMRQFHRYPTEGNFIGIVGNVRTRRLVRFLRQAMRESCEIGVESLSAPGCLPPLYLSDHSSFWKLGFPAVMITDTAFLRNPHYHQPTDSPETLNYTFLAEVVKGLYHAIIMLDRL